MTSARITIGELRRKGKLLEVGCTNCSTVRYINPVTLPLHGNLAVLEAYRRMRCLRCGEKVGYSRPAARARGAGG